MKPRSEDFCPPWCDGNPDGGIWCGGGDNHRPGWPDGEPYAHETVHGADGSTLNVTATRRPGAGISVALVVCPPTGGRVEVPLSEKEAERLGDVAWTVSAWSHRGGEI